MSSLHVFSAACMLSRLSTHAVASLLLTLPLSLVKKQYVKALSVAGAEAAGRQATSAY